MFGLLYLISNATVVFAKADLTEK